MMGVFFCLKMGYTPRYGILTREMIHQWMLGTCALQARQVGGHQKSSWFVAPVLYRLVETIAIISGLRDESVSRWCFDDMSACRSGVRWGWGAIMGAFPCKIVATLQMFCTANSDPCAEWIVTWNARNNLRRAASDGDAFKLWWITPTSQNIRGKSFTAKVKKCLHGLCITMMGPTRSVDGAPWLAEGPCFLSNGMKIMRGFCDTSLNVSSQQG